jgi:hypothetical protein
MIQERGGVPRKDPANPGSQPRGPRRQLLAPNTLPANVLGAWTGGRRRSSPVVRTTLHLAPFVGARSEATDDSPLSKQFAEHAHCSAGRARVLVNRGM